MQKTTHGARGANEIVKLSLSILISYNLGGGGDKNKHTESADKDDSFKNHDG